MSGDWMKVEVSLPDKPEVWAIADDLDLDPDAVVGKLVRVWRWFDTHTTDGNALSVTKKLLDREVGVTGFTDAMKKHGWLIVESDKITMPNFNRHNSKSAKNRALGKKRVEKHRNAKSVTNALPEKRREEKNIKQGDMPAWIKPEIWDEFETHRKEIKAKLTPTATKRLIANLDKYRQQGVNPNEALTASIENQWRGVFPERLLEKANGTGKNQSRNSPRENPVQRRTREADEARARIIAG